jgi:hypothetical protein
MFPLSIVIGIIFFVISIWYWSEIRQTPKDKLIPWGMVGGGYMTRTAAYVTILCLFFLGALCTIVGLTL